MIKTAFAKVFGTKNDRELKKYQERVKLINALEPTYQALSDQELKESFNALKEMVRSGQKSLDDVLVESFAITREASKRVLNMRHFDVQLIGGMALHEGRIAEMKTGEGKTLVATLAVALNAMMGKGVHVVTVNDYLAKRDSEEMGQLYGFLGYTTGCLVGGVYDDRVKKAQYDCDVTYGTNNEFGFDYLRDNMKYALEEMMQQQHYFAIVDEVDSILIDEARTPLIISGPTSKKLENYSIAHDVALKLTKDTHFTVDEKDKVILITEEGIHEAEKLFGVENLYDLENAVLSHHLDQALKANYLYHNDVDYVLREGEVVIVDEFTGRLSEGRRFSDGLHQALEAKEGVKIQEESQTLADITFQNYFRMYDKLAGMTGTAQTEATEFAQIYSLDVLSIPTNVPIARQDLDDLIYSSELDKFKAIALKIKELHDKGQPVLIGTASIEKNELLGKFLKKEKIPHNILNAKNHEKEAEIIADAGKRGAVTVATNMAGRGVDIKLTDEIKALGGLYIIGTERHESRRIDNQLRGRSGRQGDNGTSQFYLSLEDNLLRIFGSDKIKSIMEKIGIEEGEHIESRMVTRSVEKAQKKVESLHFDSRKHILEYDDVANEQRKTIFRFRNELLNKEYDIATKINAILKEYIENLLLLSDIESFESSEDYDIERLTLTLQEEIRFKIESTELKGKEYDELLTHLYESIKANYEAKMSRVSTEQRSEIERILYLQVLDNAWREHLYHMDVLKTGIGLQGYNQKDPLVEYKKESYNMFVDLIESIKHETIKTLLIIELRTEQEEQVQQKIESLERQMEDNAPKGNPSDGFEPIPTSKKVPRNDPCPCGSGKKYKNCCGKSGPKKGVLSTNG